MKKPIAIILAVVLILGIGAGVFWGTSWHRAIRGAGYRDPVILSDYFDDLDRAPHCRVIRATRDGQTNFLLLRQKAGLWRVESEGEVNPDNGVAHLETQKMMLHSNRKDIPVEVHLYVYGENANGRKIQFEPDELPATVNVRIDQEFEIYDLEFVWFSSVLSSDRSEIVTVTQLLESRDLM